MFFKNLNSNDFSMFSCSIYLNTYMIVVVLLLARGGESVGGGGGVLSGKKVILSHVILFLHVYLYVQFNFKCLFYLFIHLQISFEEK